MRQGRRGERLPPVRGDLTTALSFRPQRRALRTASEKLRNRLSFSTNVVYTTPGTRVNRYIGRLLEARQTELELADLNFVTLKYKQAERERKVGAGPGRAAAFSTPRGSRRPPRASRGRQA